MAFPPPQPLPGRAKQSKQRTTAMLRTRAARQHAAPRSPHVVKHWRTASGDERSAAQQNGNAFSIKGVIAAAAPPFAQEKLSVWWVKGFYKSEDDALYEAIRKFEAKTGIKVELSQYPVQDMIPKTVSALDAGTPPDVAYADVYDFQVTGKWAFDGKLEDITDVLTPMKGEFAPNTLETTFLYSDKAKKKAYYAFPQKQQTLHIHYWIDMLADAGF